jgi:hypothetical protein
MDFRHGRNDLLDTFGIRRTSEFTKKLNSNKWYVAKKRDVYTSLCH